MKVLVTGAAGFIGRHVYAALLERGHTVIGMDCVETPPYGRVVGPAGWLVDDIRRPLTKVAGLDAVVHLAALAAPRDCERDPTLAFDVNVNGTMQVLRMALESGAKKVVFSSSGHVYDIPPRYLPTDEVHPLRLNNTYTTTKILGEQLCHLYWENHGLPYTVLRLYNVYGPGQGPAYFIPDMLAKARVGDIALSGAATTKDFVYVKDVARAFALALESPFVGAINIGTGVETDLLTVASVIARDAGVRVYAASGAEAAPTRMRADIARAKQVLGWEPKVAIEEGLNAVVDQAKAVAVR